MFRKDFLRNIFSWKRKSNNVEKEDRAKLELQQLEDEKKRLQELEQILELKNNTFNSLTKDIRIPLTLLNIYLKQHISKNGETEELRIVRENLGKVTKDVVNFWDIEKLFKGFNIYNHNQISDLSQIVKDTIRLFKPYAQFKNIKIVEEVKEGITLKADPEALSRIIINLIENSLKYTGEYGEITIILFIENFDIVLKVKDSGMGIPIELQEEIFNPYNHNSEKNRNNGLGLGLAIVKKITESLDGKIKLCSNSNGTEIEIILSAYHLQSYVYVTNYSVEYDPSLSTSKLEAKDELTGDEKPTILLIVENVDFINYLYKKLRKKYNLGIALSSSEGLKKINTIKQFDLIIADMSNGNDSEFEFYKDIVADKKYNHIPFFFLTSNSTIEDKLRGLSYGAIDCIEMPFFIDELISKIESFLKNLENQRIKLINSAYQQIKGSRITDSEPAIPENFENNCKNYNLSKREIDVAKLLIKGMAHKEIGDSLDIEVTTVSRHTSNIFSKTKVNKNTELVKILGYPRD